MEKQAFQINVDDNVATVLKPVEGGETVGIVSEGTAAWSCVVAENIGAGHKVALRSIAVAEEIVKYGVSIGHASENIEPGSWVHLHNCRSNYDARSADLDLTTGASRDVVYE